MPILNKVAVCWNVILSKIREALIVVLTFLSGKKTTIVALLATVMSYLALKEVIGNDELVLFNSILVVLGFGANVATKKLVKSNSK